MNSEYDEEFEKELIKLKFKKICFSDKSGHWWTKNIKFKDLKLQLYVETDRKVFELLCEVYPDSDNEAKKQYDCCQVFKCDLKTINRIIKKYNE